MISGNFKSRDDFVQILQNKLKVYQRTQLFILFDIIVDVYLKSFLSLSGGIAIEPMPKVT
jgi:hypothetical protein